MAEELPEARPDEAQVAEHPQSLEAVTGSDAAALGRKLLEEAGWYDAKGCCCGDDACTEGF